MKASKWILGIVLALFILGGASWYFFGSGFLFKTPQLCSVEPTSSNCYCLEGYNKLDYKGWYGTKYFCESQNKIINIDNSGWEDNAKTLAATKLQELFPDCNMASCEGDWHNATLQIASGIETSQLRRIVQVECNEVTEYTLTGAPKSGVQWSSIELDITTGEATNARCGSKIDIEEVLKISPTYLELTGWNNPYSTDMTGNTLVRYTLYSTCENEGLNEVTNTFYAEEPTIGKFGEWEIVGTSILSRAYDSNSIERLILSDTPASLDCEIVEGTDSYVTTKCNVDCAQGVGRYEEKFNVVGYYKPEVFQARSKCNLANGGFRVSGQTIVCNTDKTKYLCGDNGWESLSVGFSSGSSVCPA